MTQISVAVGKLEVLMKPKSFEDMEKMNPEMLPGGRFTPTWCKPRHRVAIVIPYRNRTEQLGLFLLNYLPILQRQLTKFGIFVIDLVSLTLYTLSYVIYIFTHLKLCLSTETHNFRSVETTHIC